MHVYLLATGMTVPADCITQCGRLKPDGDFVPQLLHLLRIPVYQYFESD